MEGMRKVNIKNCASLVQYFAWMEDHLKKNPDSDMTEYTAAKKLEEFRKTRDLYMGPSFDTISSMVFGSVKKIPGTLGLFDLICSVFNTVILISAASGSNTMSSVVGLSHWYPSFFNLSLMVWSCLYHEL